MNEVSGGAGTADPSSFATALRGAIETSGLGLEQIQRRLSRRGHGVSLAALSYWRSGRSVPSRTSSLDAVAELEPILGLAPGSLGGLLAGGAGDEPEPTTDHLGEPVLAGIDPSRLHPALADLLTSSRIRVELVSDHQRVVLDADCRCTAAYSRRVYRALVDGVDRVLVATSLPDGVRLGTGLVAIGRGRPAARAVLDNHVMVLTEFRLDRTLRRGEAIMLELGLERSAGVTTCTPREVCGCVPLRELVVEVQFDSRALPQEIEWYEGGPDAAADAVTPLALDANASILVLRHDVRAVRHGVRWVWAPAG